MLQNTTPSTTTTTTTLPPVTRRRRLRLRSSKRSPTPSTTRSTAPVPRVRRAGRRPAARPPTRRSPSTRSPSRSGSPTSPTTASSSPAPWASGGEIPVEYTCTGAEDGAAAHLDAPPAGTVEVALVVEDESADDFAHWIVIALPPEAGSVGGPEPLTVGTEATNSAWRDRLGRPVPTRRRARTRTASPSTRLSQAIELPPESQPADLIQAIEASATGATSFTGTYQVA